MSDRDLIWKTTEKETIFHSPVLDIVRQAEVSETGLKGDYYSIKAPDWVVVVPVYEESFVLVKQWRHGESNLTTEFPGGVMNPDETPEETAYRELLEETGFKAGKLTCIGSCSPNPALFANHFYCFLAEDLTQTGKQHPDSDELIDYMLMPVGEVMKRFGSKEFSHAFMGTALAFYMKHKTVEKPYS